MNLIDLPQDILFQIFSTFIDNGSSALDLGRTCKVLYPIPKTFYPVPISLYDYSLQPPGSDCYIDVKEYHCRLDSIHNFIGSKFGTGSESSYPFLGISVYGEQQFSKEEIELEARIRFYQRFAFYGEHNEHQNYRIPNPFGMGYEWFDHVRVGMRGLAYNG